MHANIKPGMSIYIPLSSNNWTRLERYWHC